MRNQVYPSRYFLFVCAWRVNSTATLDSARTPFYYIGRLDKHDQNATMVDILQYTEKVISFLSVQRGCATLPESVIPEYLIWVFANLK